MAVRNRYAEGVVKPRDPNPPLPQPEEGVLHDLFGLVAIAGHEAQRPEEPSVLRPEELLEALAFFSHLGPHDLGFAHHVQRAIHHGS
jgi:hypothetical protein